MTYRDSAQSNPIMDTFKLVAETRRQAEDVTEKAKVAVKAHYKNPDDLAAFIEKQGTPVYVISGLKGFLVRFMVFALGYEPGFIAPPVTDPLSAKRYNSLKKILAAYDETKNDFSFDKGVFVLPKALYTVGYIAHQLHHWLAFLAGLPGYSTKEQEEFRRFMVERKGQLGPEVERMTLDQLAGLRNAIHREIEALKFIKSVTEEIFRPARQARNLSNGAANA
jgi:hypothetical protein